MTASPIRPRRLPLFFLALAAVWALTALPLAAQAEAAIPANYFTVVDTGGPNDAPSQSDMTQMGRDDSDPDFFRLFWSWDATDDWTGVGQTGDACALFDSDGDSMVNAVVCVQIDNTDPADPTLVQQTAGSPFVFSCDDVDLDRCDQPIVPIIYVPFVDVKSGALGNGSADPAASPPANLVTNTDPFLTHAVDGTENRPNDSTIEIIIRKSLLPAGSELVNVCTYPSAGAGGNNNPFDCIVNPGSGFLSIVKAAPAGSTTTFNFEADPGDIARSIVGSGTASPVALAVGSGASVTETVPANHTLANAACVREGGAATGTFATPAVTGVQIESGKVTTCTFTNTLNPGKLEVVKDVVGNAGDDTFNLKVGNDVVKENATDGQGSGELSKAPATYTVSEVAGTAPAGTNLGDYQKSIVCKGNNGTGSVVAQTTAGQDISTLDVQVGSGDDIVCTVTNEREQGNLEVVKDVIGNAGDDTFNLKVGADVVKENATDGQGSGELDKDTGTYAISETAGTAPAGTDLGDYQKSIVCKDNNGTGTTVASLPADSPGPLNVTVGYQDDIVCTITNDREQGSLEVVKDVIGNAGNDTFNLKVDSDVVKENATDGQGSGELPKDTGTYTVSEVAGTAPAGTNLGDYQKSIVCKDNDGTGSVVAQTTAGQDISTLNVTVGYQDDIVCVVTNEREQGNLEVVKDVIGNAGDDTFNLKVDSDVVKENATDGQGSGELDKDTGTYAISETAGTAPAGTDLGEYRKSIVCKDGNGTGTTVASLAPDSAGPLNVTVGYQDDIVCVVTNEREQGTLEVVKDVVGSAGDDTFNLKVDSDVVKENATDGQGSGELDKDTGTYAISETAGTAPAGTDLGDYQKSIVCKDGNGTGTTVASLPADSPGPLNVTVGYQDDIVCVVTNEREQGTLEVVKDVVGNAGDDTFNLKVDSDVVKENATDGEGSGPLDKDTGTYAISEAPGTAPVGTDLADYQKSIVCKDGDGQGTTVAQTSGDDAGPLNVTVGYQDDIVCVVTNEREQGSLEVVKDVVGNAGDDTFNLKIGSDVVKENATDGQGSGELDKDTGTYAISETAGTAPAGTDLGEYQKSIVCKDGDGQGATVAQTSGDDAGPLNVTVGYQDDIVCVVTNEREQGTLEVVKDVVGSAGDDTFNLKVDSDVVKENATDGQGSGELDKDTGTYAISETAGTAPAGTDLTEYDKSIVCKDGDGLGAIVAQTSGDDAGPLNVTVGYQDDIVCTVTNARETGKLEVVKDVVGNAGDDTFNLKVGNDIVRQNATDGQGSGELIKETGTYAVSETAGSAPAGTDLGDYQKSIVCKDGDGQGATVAQTSGDDAGPLNVALANGDDIVCVITNEREQGSLEVVKDVVGSAGDDTFNLKVGSDVVKENATDGQGSGELDKDTGTYAISETAGTAPAGTDLGDYQKSIVCKDGDGQGTTVAQTSGDDAGPLNVAVGHNDDIVCVVTNEREQGTLEVVKDVIGDAGDDTFNLKVDSDVVKENATDGQGSGELDKDTGTYAISETAGTAPAGTDLGNYLKSIVCKDGNGQGQTVGQTDGAGPLNVTVGHNDDIVCTVTNDVNEGTLIVEKQTDPDETNGGLFGFTTNAPGGPASFNLADDQTDVRDVFPGTYNVTEDAKTGYRLTGIDCGPVEEVDRVARSLQDRTATVDIGPGETVRCVFTNLKLNASAIVVKSGNEFAYHGDNVTFTYVVTNPGNSPLHDVVVTDDKCTSVTGPDKQVNGGSADELDPGDRWIYTCTMPVPAHSGDEANPLKNVVTVAAKDEQGSPVGATDDHLTRILHPAIAVDKTGPAEQTAGQPIDYAIVVTNPGDVSFASDRVSVQDSLCEAPPALIADGKRRGDGADPSPDTLDPGDTWVYTCRVQTAIGQERVDNVATVNGTDFNGRTVQASDPHGVLLRQPVQQQAPQRTEPGAARLQGPTSCVVRPFTAIVRGRQIASVTLFVGKRRIRTLTAQQAKVRVRKAQAEQVFRFRIDPRDLRGSRVQRVRARVVFTTESGTAARTLRLAFQRCRAARAPRFTG